MIAEVATTLAGLAGLAGTWLVWTGRWRTPGRSVIAPNWAWTSLPTVSLILLTYGLRPIVGDALAYITGPVALVSFVMMFWDPSWYGPRWWRERDKDEMDLMAPDNAYLYAAMGPGLGADGSIHQAERMMGGAEPEARVHGALITERHGRPSALQRAGSVEGRFLLYERGIVFAASPYEDKMRKRAVVERLAGDQIRRVERLRRGTRESGRRSFRDLRTLVSATLCIDAGAESWIVETVHGRRLLGEIERLYGVRAEDRVATPAARSHQKSA